MCNLVSLFSQKADGDIANLNLGELDLTTDEFILDEVDSKTSPNCYISHIFSKLLANGVKSLASKVQEDVPEVSAGFALKIVFFFFLLQFTFRLIWKTIL